MAMISILDYSNPMYDVNYLENLIMMAYYYLIFMYLLQVSPTSYVNYRSFPSIQLLAISYFLKLLYYPDTVIIIYQQYDN